MHYKLEEIYKAKLEEIKGIEIGKHSKRVFPVVKFKEQIEIKDGISLIAEIKKASPSKGVIRSNFNLDEIIQAYSSFPADAVSILTDKKFFQGEKGYLSRFKSISKKIPVLRKDFIIDERQVYESFYLGADIILLIVAMLPKEQLQNLFSLAKKLGMEILVETHTQDEIKLALEIGAEMIGINSRDLNTFNVNLNNTLNLVSLIPDNIIKVAESGIHTREDTLKVEDAGFDVVLIGEAFMASDNIQQTYNKLFKK